MIKLLTTLPLRPPGPTSPCRRYGPVSMYCDLINVNLQISDVYDTEIRLSNKALVLADTMGALLLAYPSGNYCFVIRCNDD